ncbi:RHS repeat-associated core domain-containing protein [Bacillus cereus]|uniref:RHS repeat-associated core domain-containing protein n=1 Tax=Bacillus cereus TaxID=1396 RepID=UPI002B249354|nr:RHS repeat-associated core domain-containing protein [Bacillus cereus]MEB2584117.1 RHS repeat-associated core domain-containing protein [Bacillus cereus]MEB2611597.1 RHS repeat-associated core domain-containing protein [Bacillus cereus]
MSIKHFNIDSSKLNVLEQNRVLSKVEYYPYGNTVIWLDHSEQEANYKTSRYSEKERDTTGLYYYGYRYYQPCYGRWLGQSPHPLNILDLVRMASNSSIKKVKEIYPKKLR